MTLYVMDTDHLSLFQRNHPIVVSRVFTARKRPSDELATTVVSMEEQLKGRLAQVSKASSSGSLVLSYTRRKTPFEIFSNINVLDYSADADARFRTFRKSGVRIGTQDLRIASIVLAHGGVLLTRNLRDFEKVTELMVQDWSIEAS